MRLYLETMETVYSNTTKIVVDTKGTGNMLYLPLDKIMSANADSKPTRSANTVQAPQQPAKSNNRYQYPDTNSSNVRPDRFNTGRN